MYETNECTVPLFAKAAEVIVHDVSRPVVWLVCACSYDECNHLQNLVPPADSRRKYVSCSGPEWWCFSLTLPPTQEIPATRDISLTHKPEHPGRGSPTASPFHL